LNSLMQVVRFEQASRFRGERERQHIQGQAKIQEDVKRYYFNTKCRRLYLEN
jgi:hypothetical protein